jgi:riboflavin biosynthesis pyrimidine reductase
MAAVYISVLLISYIFGGKDRLNFSLVVEKLRHLFSIDELLLEGGGFLNVSFLNEGLIDELSLIIAPMVDGESGSVTLFETSSFLKKATGKFPLEEHRKTGRWWSTDEVCNKTLNMARTHNIAPSMGVMDYESC